MLFSLVVPVYNVEKYIDRCVKSILSQSCTDYEVYFVYDVSKDNSLEILRSWCEKRPEFHLIINSEKKGLSYARNLGVEASNGEYIIFVDSDDYILPDALSYLADAISKNRIPDWIYANGHYDFTLEKTKDITLVDYIEGLDSKTFDSGKEVLSSFLDNGISGWSMWGKAYRREFWNKMGCIPHRPCMEDIDVGYKIMERAQNVAVVPAFYCYMKSRPDSALNTFAANNLYVFAEIMTEMLDYLKDDNLVDDDLKDKIYRKFNNECCESLFAKIYFAKGLEREKLLKKASKLTEYFNYPYCFRNKIISLIYRVIGLRATCAILGFAKKCRYKRLGHNL